MAQEVEEVIAPEEAPPTALAPIPRGDGRNDDFTQMVRVARAMVASGYFAGTQSVAQAVVRMLAGQELGLPAVASMTGIYVVRGRISLSSNVIGALIKRSNRYDYLVRVLTNSSCEIEFLQRDYNTGQWHTAGISTFSMDDARRAGVLRKDSPWESHSRNMLFARALTNGARWFCPDIFNGPIFSPEELQNPSDEQEPTLAQEESSASSDNAEN